MGTIQAGINQLIGLAAIGGKFYADSPAGQAATASRHLKRGEKIEEKLRGIEQGNTLPADKAVYPGQRTPAGETARKAAAEQLGQNVENAKIVAMNNPSSASVSKLAELQQRQKAQNTADTYIDEHKDRFDRNVQGAIQRAGNLMWAKAAPTPEQVNARMAQIGMQQIQQKRQYRKFKDYIGDEPVSLGGVVSDYPPEMQKKIAASYSPSQRKKIMDMKDAQRKKEKEGDK